MDGYNVYLMIWLGGCFLIGSWSREKLGSFWTGFLWSFFLSPLIGLIVVAASKAKNREVNDQSQWNIPDQQNAVPSKSKIPLDINNF